MKYEWRKSEKDIYLPQNKITIISIPKMKYLTITGKGNPNNNPDFQERISALYSLSYAIRMMPRNGYTPHGYFEYTVYPLEGIWDLTEKGRRSETLDKDELLYKIMIRQPDFVNSEVIAKAYSIVEKKKTTPLIEEVNFEDMEEGLCVQMLHIGPYDDEPQSFEKMNQYIVANNYERTTLTHKEIYISDFRKVAPEKLKTVLRYKIKTK